MGKMMLCFGWKCETLSRNQSKQNRRGKKINKREKLSSRFLFSWVTLAHHTLATTHRTPKYTEKLRNLFAKRHTEPPNHYIPVRSRTIDFTQCFSYHKHIFFLPYVGYLLLVHMYFGNRIEQQHRLIPEKGAM